LELVRRTNIIISPSSSSSRSSEQM